VLGLLDTAAKILFVAIFFGLCIFFHELGHLLVALWRGLHVERFSVGFGKKLWSTTYRNVEYVVSALPFGGYVSLPQLDPTEEPHTSDGVPLPRASAGSRALTAVAGPIANLIFGFMLGLVTWAVGVYEPAPAHDCVVWSVPRYLPLYKGKLEQDDTVLAVDGQPVSDNWESILDAIPAGADSVTLRVRHDGEERTIDYKPVPNPEYEAGLRPHDRILAVNGQTFSKGWRELSEMIALNTDDLVLVVERPGGTPHKVVYRPYPNPVAEGLGYPFFEVVLPTEASRIFPDSPAEKAGLKVGDRLVLVNGERVPDAAWFINKVAESKGAPLDITVMRNGAEITIENVRAKAEEVDGETVYRIGMALSAPRVLAHPNPWEQFVSVVVRTKRTLASLFAPVAGRKSLVRPRHMSGPIGIVQMIWYRLQTEGYRGGLSIIILVTFSLAFFNLLPIPVLDGGHILYSGIEVLIRRRLPTRLVHVLQNAFAILIIGFMLYITSHDVRRWVRVWRFFHPKEEQVEQAPGKGRDTTDEPAENAEQQKAAEALPDAADTDAAKSVRDGSGAQAPAAAGD
jgi:regulator of sigma E protease